MKATITADAQGYVTLRFDHPLTDERVTETFACPLGGGYVRDSKGRQVCDALATTGSTLLCSGRDNLINVIRREYRQMRREYARRTRQRNY